ncbi:MAG: hypothetical protein ACRC5H_10485 [Treponemataceae bacterium]
MTTVTVRIHELCSKHRRLSFPFKKQDIPNNGIYIIFEKGETFGEFDRIVRVGTHTGENQLYSRLLQHFVKENKNRSIFRKNIGRCFLNRLQDPYLKLWDLDTTSKADKDNNLKLLDLDYEKEIEQKITTYIQENLSFCVFQVETKAQRLFWESKIVSTLAKSKELKPSIDWLGNYSTKEKIRESGLWQVNELNNEELTEAEFQELKELLR